MSLPRKVLLFCLMTALLLPSCGEPKAEIPPDTVSIVAAKKKYRGHPEEIAIVWHNNSEHNIMFGETYHLETLLEDEWVELEMEERGFVYTGIVLLAGGTCEHGYETQYHYNDLSPGQYRLVTAFTTNADENDSDNPSSWEKHVLTAEFVIQ